MSGHLFLRAVLVLVMLGSATANPRLVFGQTQGDLVSGKIVEGSTGTEDHATFSFEAESAGVLTIVARSLDETDLLLLVTDSDGQPLPNGRSDQDFGGDPGAEQFAIPLPRAGKYQVRVETFGGSRAAFKIGVSWLSFPDLALPSDPDGSPSSAIRIQVGQDTWDDLIDGAEGDYWDWFVLKAEKGGTLTVATRAEEGDLVLEAFTPGDFTEPLERSDQDLQGTGGNEALTLAVEAGEEFFFRVSAFSEGVSGPYRLQIGFIPD